VVLGIGARPGEGDRLPRVPAHEGEVARQRFRETVLRIGDPFAERDLIADHLDP